MWTERRRTSRNLHDHARTLRPLDSGPGFSRGALARDVAPNESRGRPERAQRVEGRRQWSPGLARWAPLLCALSIGLWGVPASALERDIHTKITNYDSTPVTLQDATLQLVRTYSTPSQIPFATLGSEDLRIQRNRTRYMNRLNQEVPTFLLEGELAVRNLTRQTVEAVQITTVFLNAFRERISVERQSLTKELAPRQLHRVKWSRGFPDEEVFEVVFVITAVRFTDGTVWAPTEELILLP